MEHEQLTFKLPAASELLERLRGSITPLNQVVDQIFVRIGKHAGERITPDVLHNIVVEAIREVAPKNDIHIWTLQNSVIPWTESLGCPQNFMHEFRRLHASYVHQNFR